MPARSSDSPRATSRSPRHAVVGRARQLARPQRRAVVRGGLLPGQHPVGAAGGGEREVDRALGPLDRRGEREVVRELGQVGVGVGPVQRGERLADAAVQPRAAQLGDAVVERGPHQRVGERVAPDRAGLAQHARVDGLLERGDERVAGGAVAAGRDALEQLEVELAADHRAHHHGLGGVLAQPPQAARGHLAHAVGHARLGERHLGPEPLALLAQVADDLLDEERVALRLAVQRADELGRGRGHAERGDQLADLVLPSPPSSSRFSAPSRRRSPTSSCSGCSGGELGLAVGAEEQDVAGLRGAHEVAHELQRRAVGPVHVLEHDHGRRGARDLADQRRHRVEEAQAPRVGRRAADGRAAVVRRRRPELRQQDAQLVRRGRRGARAAGRAAPRPTIRAASRPPAGRARASPRRSARRAPARPSRRARGGRTRRRCGSCRCPRRRPAGRAAGRRPPPRASSPAGTPARRRGRRARGGRARRPAAPASVTDSADGCGGRAGGSGGLPVSSRSCTASAAAPGEVPSSSRSSTRRRSNARSASAGLPAASWTSISARWADSRNGAAAIAARAACSAGPSSRPPRPAPAKASASSARSRRLSHSLRRSLDPQPRAVGQEASAGRAPARPSPRARRRPTAARRSPPRRARRPRRPARRRPPSSPPGCSRSSARPASTPSPSARRSLESSALSAESAAAGGSSGHRRSTSSARGQARSRFRTR